MAKLKAALAALALCAGPAWGQAVDTNITIKCAPRDDAIGWLKGHGYKPTETGQDANGDTFFLMQDSLGNWMLFFDEDGLMCKVGGGVGWKSGKPT